MARRVRIWGGSAVAVAALAGLGVYFARVGLEDADKLASVIGVFVGLVGLGVAVYGVVADRRSGHNDTGDRDGDGDERPEAPTSGEQAAVGGDSSGNVATGGGATNVQQRAEASGDGRVYQAGRDQTINEK